MDMEQDRPANAKAKLTEVNAYLTCPLCKGYYIDATTIVECLHSFCKSCIIQHLQVDNYCPICELMINTAKPNIKPDKTLQDIVYKLVPGLYTSEMSRRRRFWAEHPEEAAKVTCPEARGLMTERIIFSPQDAISLSIEYTSDEHAAWNRSEPDPEIPLRRYLQCPAMLQVEHLKKFICNKYNVDNQLYHVDILYKRVPLPDHYTLMDIAYIYSWKRNEPMKFFFRITDIALVSERFDYFEPSSKQNLPTTVRTQRTNKQTTIPNNNNNNNNKNNKNIDNNKSSTIIPPDSNEPSKDKTCDKKKIEEQKCVEKNNKPKIEVKSDCESKAKHTEVEVKQDIKDNAKQSECKKLKVEEDKVENKADNNNKQISENSESVESKKDEEILNNKTVLKTELKVPNNINNKIPVKSPKVKSEPTKSPGLLTIDEDPEKSKFLEQIQLTAKNPSPPALKPIKPISPEATPKSMKRKYVRKTDKIPAKKLKVDIKTNKTRKIAPKKVSENGLKMQNIKNPLVWLMVSNLNKQATNLTKIVNQTDSSKINNTNEHNQNESLQNLIDSCKLNIPSSLSITLTESHRNEDGTILEPKPAIMKPVQNYIEILKLPDRNSQEIEKTNEESPKKVDLLKIDNNTPLSTKNSIQIQNQKQTFQTMFEEAIKREEHIKAQEMCKILNHAKKVELVKTETKKKQQSNALDLSTNSSNSDSTPKSPTSPTSPTTSTTLTTPTTPTTPTVSTISTTPTIPTTLTIPTTVTTATTLTIPTSPTKEDLSLNSPVQNVKTVSPNSTNKKNILEIAHQLSKRSRIESNSTKEQNGLVSPPKQIIINNNNNSGGSISIKRSPPNKVPIPRLPISRVPTPMLNPPKIQNGLLKFSNYTAKLAINAANPPKSLTPLTVSPTQKIESTIHNLTPNQLQEKYNISNLAQFNANLNQAQIAFQQALMVSHQLEMHRMHQNSQKRWVNNFDFLAHYENYVQNLKNRDDLYENDN